MKTYKWLILRIKIKHIKQKQLKYRIEQFYLGKWKECIVNSKNIDVYIKYPISLPNYYKIFQLKDRLSRIY